MAKLAALPIVFLFRFTANTLRVIAWVLDPRDAPPWAKATHIGRYDRRRPGPR
jgi:hypothetical protein